MKERDDLPEQFGRYRIEKKLGQGGMGTVYLAHDTQLDRPVALKVPRFHDRPTPQLRERFLREARAAATLSHANICPVHDAGEIDGVLFATMAFIEGRSLAEVIGADETLPQRAVAAVIRKLALALQAAHEKGVVHRDLKPANVMVTREGEPIIMDFGLALRTDRDQPRLTSEGMMIGTPAYMPPEQVRGEVGQMGPACDVYSLGVVLYEMLAGRLPFEGPALSVVNQVLNDPPPPLAEFRPDVDPALASICATALAKKPAERHTSMKAFADALTAYLQGGRPVTRTLPATIAPDQPTQPERPPTGPPTDAGGTEMLARLLEKLDGPASARRRKLIWACAGLLLAAGVLVLAIALLLHKERVPGGDGTIVVLLPGFTVNYDNSATFFLDGKEVARAELEDRLKLVPGEHEIIVKVGGKALAVHRFKVGAADAGREIVPAVQEPPGEAGEIRSYVGFENQLAGVAFLADGQQFVAIHFATQGMTIRGGFSLWNLGLLKSVRSLTRPVIDQPYRPRALAVSPDGKRVLIGWQGNRGRGYLDYRELPGLEQVWPMREGHTTWITRISFTPDGRRALSSDDSGVAIVWDLATGKEVDRIVGKLAVFSPDGMGALASDRENQLWLWKQDGVSLKRHEQPFKGPTKHVNGLAFSPDGKHCAAASTDRNVYVFEVASRKLVHTLRGHKPIANDVTFSPDGTRLLSCGENVRLWDMRTGKEIRSFEGHAGAVHAVAFSPGGGRALSGGNDRTVRLWQLP